MPVASKRQLTYVELHYSFFALQFDIGVPSVVSNIFFIVRIFVNMLDFSLYFQSPEAGALVVSWVLLCF